MIVYESTKQEFMTAVENDIIANKIREKYSEKFGKANEAEVRAWNNSMEYMYKVLNDSFIPGDSGVAIEFNIPTTSKRIDFILTGKDEVGKESAIIIELKQWEKAEKVEGKDAIVKTFVGNGVREVAHPSYQAWSYASLIKDYNASVQEDEVSLHPCAYLHNYQTNDNDDLLNEVYKDHLEKAPVYVKGDVTKLRDFIKKYIKHGDQKETLYKIENGKLRPSKSLQDSLSSLLKGNKEFTLIDEQKVVYETALQLALNSYKYNQKNVLIVKGGPGTGKSVLAINLLVELTSKNLVCQYVSKNSAPRNVYATKLKGEIKKTNIDNLFKGSGSYTDTEKNYFDALIVDEAHRLNEKSGMFKNFGENQVKEIINASKFSIFFIDEHQRVTIDDIGSVQMIEHFAEELKANVATMQLDSQFRCNGSDGYLAWIDHVLQIRETANFDGFDDYDFRIADDPNELRDLIFEKNKINNKARLLAGYCWDWKKEGKSKSDVHDIVIPEYNFSMSWNLDNSTTWAIDPNSVNEVGCIHTSQGLEFDYVGVIIGDDLRFEDGKVITDFTKRAKTDNSLKGIKSIAKRDINEANEIADEIIKNTYRTLLTRGQKGCYVYIKDYNLVEYFK